MAGSRSFRHAWIVGSALLAAASARVADAATPAGARIANTARMTTGSPGAAAVDSNTVILTVDTQLDVTLAADARSIDVAENGPTVAVGFRVTNTGNAIERFALTAATDAPGPRMAGFATDDDGDGAYDPVHDAALAAPEVTLKPGESRHLFSLVSGAAAASISMTATAATGHGAAGTSFAGAGVNGGDAVVGITTASATATTALLVGGGDPRLEKSQSVRAPDGSARVMPGAVVTYQLDARFPRATVAAEVSDAVPAGLSFVPGSITLDSSPLTDAADGDAGRLEDGVVHVSLGNIVGAATRTIRFQAIIQ